MFLSMPVHCSSSVGGNYELLPFTRYSLPVTPATGGQVLLVLSVVEGLSYNSKFTFLCLSVVVRYHINIHTAGYRFAFTVFYIPA